MIMLDYKGRRRVKNLGKSDYIICERCLRPCKTYKLPRSHQNLEKILSMLSYEDSNDEMVFSNIRLSCSLANYTLLVSITFISMFG